MEVLSLLLQNKILIAAVIGWTVAQVSKTLIHLYFTKRFVAERLVGSGGMPSSHSATVCALSAATCIQFGVGSFEFAMAATFAIVVMYDAIGVRRETGIQAQIINEMMDLFNNMNQELSREEKLKEFVGHTPIQVLVGAILGILIGIGTMNWL